MPISFQPLGHKQHKILTLQIIKFLSNVLSNYFLFCYKNFVVIPIKMAAINSDIGIKPVVSLYLQLCLQRILNEEFRRWTTKVKFNYKILKLEKELYKTKYNLQAELHFFIPIHNVFIDLLSGLRGKEVERKRVWYN